MREAFETYSIFKNLDDSVLLINDVLKVFNFEFQKISIKGLQDNFAELFNYKKSSDRSPYVNFQGEKVKSNFFKLILKSPFFLSQFNKSDDPMYYIFLKDLEPDNSALLNETVHLSFKSFARTQKFSEVLLNKLRLYKSGNISSIGYIIISEKSRHIFLSAIEFTPKIAHSRNYSLKKDDAPLINKTLLSEFKINRLSELAFQNFQDSYRIIDPRLRFLTLMTALECIFNCGKDQIAHTISRHVALIVSKDPDSFQINYTKMKKLYNLRNDYIHGSSIKKPKEDLFELEEYVREALNYTLKSDSTKEALFTHLNKMGY